MINISYSLIAIGLFIYVVYKWVTINNDYFKRRGLKHLKPNFFFGNTGGYFFKQHRIHEFISYLYNAFPSEKYLIYT